MELQGVKVTWLGHATLLLETPEGKKILVDPFLESNPSCPPAYHDVEVDAILITHGHNDHIGDVFTAAERCKGPIVGIFDLTSWLGRKGVPGDKLEGMNKGGRIRIDDLQVNVTMTDARHSSSFQDEDGNNIYLGEAAGYVVEFSNDFRIYISGDTCLFGDMEWIGDLYEPHLAIMAIGDRFTMDPRTAAIACDLLGVDAVIPYHFDTWPLLTGTPKLLKDFIETYELEVEVHALEPGQTFGK